MVQRFLFVEIHAFVGGKRSRFGGSRPQIQDNAVEKFSVVRLVTHKKLLISLLHGGGKARGILGGGVFTAVFRPYRCVVGIGTEVEGSRIGSGNGYPLWSDLCCSTVDGNADTQIILQSVGLDSSTDDQNIVFRGEICGMRGKKAK